ncbi:MAG: polysaccharide deacetylase family protein [Cytophagales bacterium]|nr:MAG: polysaccharide deacetylase family protein [Cytophagales bacterium]TAF59606.1 MAG: polysaccharide deacetylase family protein [Cytophagales bacterium]
MYLHKTSQIIQRAFPNFVWHKATSEKIIYLTFDDGPIPNETEYVLDLLQLAGAKATFFCVGDNVRKHPDIFKRILREGHEVGNHTYNHLNGWNSNLDTYIQNVEACRQVMTQVAKDAGIPLKLRFFRPPYGRLSPQQSGVIKETYQVVMWDVLTGDFDAKLDPIQCYNKAIKNTEQGSIVIFHDSLKAARTMRHVLPLYLDYFLNKGYRFAALS